MIRVEFYGRLAELAGKEAVDLPLQSSETLDQVLARLCVEWPQLAEQLPTTACALNDELVRADARVSPGATLALLPPVSGG